MTCRCIESSLGVCVQDCPEHYLESEKETVKRYKAKYQAMAKEINGGWRTDGWGRDWLPTHERVKSDRAEVRSWAPNSQFRMYSDAFVPHEFR